MVNMVHGLEQCMPIQLVALFRNEPTNRQTDQNRPRTDQKSAVGFFHRIDCLSSLAPPAEGQPAGCRKLADEKSASLRVTQY